MTFFNPELKKMHNLKYFFIFALCLLASGLFAQQYTVETNILLSPPYPTNLDAYVDYLEEGIIEITNLKDEPHEVFFDILLEETSGKFFVNTDGVLGEVMTIQPGINILTPADIQSVFGGLTEENFNTSGLSQAEKDAIMLNRQMPEGGYRICIQAFDEVGTQLSDPSLGCVSFDVFFAERPIITSPFDGEESDTSGFLFITWDHTINSPGVTDRLEYTVKIIDITEQEVTNVQLAMLDPGLSPEYEEEFGNQFNVNLLHDVDMPLIIAHQYAIRVTASDPEDGLGFQFGGHSEVVVFQYGFPDMIGGGNEVAAPEIVSPEDGDELDLTEDSTLVVNVEWEHDVDNLIIGSLKYTARLMSVVEGDDPSYEDFLEEDAELTWESDEIQKIFSIEADDETELELGNKYAVLVSVKSNDENLKFENDGHSEVITFTFGVSAEDAFDAPQVEAPTDGEYLSKKEIPLTWSHDFNAEKLDAKLLTYRVQVIDMTDEKVPSPTIANFEDAKINKFLDQPITDNESILKPTAANPMRDYHKYAVVVFVETDEEDIEFKNGGYSEIVIFTHGLKPVDEDGCDSDNQDITIIDNSPVVIPVNAAQTKLYKMGTMDLRIKKLNTGGSAEGGYSGTGEIMVGFLGLGTKILVDFTGIKVNKSGQIIEGQAEASYDDAFGNVDKLAAAGASTLLDIDFAAAKNLNASLRSTKKLVSAFTGTQAVSLPLGFDKTIEEDTIIVGITKMTFTPQKANLMAMFSMVNSDWGEYVPTFGASNIEFHNNGFEKQIRLYLHEDYPIETDGGTITIIKSDPNNPTAELGTYVELNCKGFKKAQLTAELPISRDVLLPENPDGTIVDDENTRAMLTLSGTIERQSNWMMSASLTPCQIPGLDGFSLTMEKGTYDGSVRSNPPGITFPQGYEVDATRELWKGVWFQEVKIMAPADWSGASGGSRTSIAMQNFIKDDTGISLKGVGYNLLNIEDGSFEGFAISMDTLNIDIIKSQFRNVSLSGQLGMPILPDDSYLGYTGMVDMSGNNATANQTAANNNTPINGQNDLAPDKTAMTFSVQPDANGYYLPWVKSSIKFDETTQIIMKNDEKERGIEALIEGTIAIGRDIRGDQPEDEEASILKFPDLRFTGMSISSLKDKVAKSGNQAPANQGKASNLKFKPPAFEFDGFSPLSNGDADDKTVADDTKTTQSNDTKEPTANGFSIGLTKVELTFGDSDSDAEQEISDGMGLKLTVGGEVAIVRAPKAKAGGKKSKGFELSAEGEFSLMAKVKKTGSKMSFAYDRFDSAKLVVDSKLGPININGELEIYNNDPEFGDGVVGDVHIDVPMLSVDVEARFGNMTKPNKDQFGYFYLFGKLDFEPGILIPQTPIKLHRFLGGAYSNMSIKPGAELAERAKDKYMVNDAVAFGFKAGLGFSVTSPSAVMATMAFEMALTKDGGIERIALDGQVDMMQTDPFGDLSGENFEGVRLKAVGTVLPAMKSEDGTFVEGRENMKFDCQFSAKANIADGTIVGAKVGADPYTVVDGSLDIDGESFGLEAGTIFNKGIIRAKLGDQAGIDGKFYLQASYGKTVDFPEAPVPDFINRLLAKGKNEDFDSKGGDPKSKDANSYPSNGLAIAAGLNINAKADIEYSILYAKFQAMLGFDMSLKTNKNTVCKNNGGEALGMGRDGYYAQGQVYAGLEGDVGLNIDVFGYKGKLQLAYVYAAMLVQGGFANPSWVKGEAAMGYSVLNGLVSGNTSFEIAIGEKCEAYQANPFAGVKFIEGIDPTSGKTGVSPFVKPILSFENKIADYYFKSETGRAQHFHVRLEKFAINGVSAPYETSQDLLSAHLKVESLKPYKKYTISARVKVWEYDYYGVKKWIPYINKEGKEVVETIEHTFTTGAMPENVPWNNVQDCYPFRNEKYYMVNDNVNKKGILKLGGSQAALFAPFTPYGQQWHSKIQAKIYDWGTSTYVSRSDIKYYPGTGSNRNIITYDLKNLKTSKSYALVMERVWYKNKNYDTSSRDITDKSVATTENASVSSNYTFKKEGKTYANATNKKPSNKNIFQYEFKSSWYQKFEHKIKGGNNPTATQRQNYSILQFDINNREGFSQEEIGYKYIAESRSLNKNMAFVKEDLTKFAGSAMISGFKKVKSRFHKYAKWSYDMKLFDYKFENNNWRYGFDKWSINNRYLYYNESKGSIRFVSTAYTLLPLYEDIEEYDYMIYHLIEGAYEYDYEDDHESEYDALEKRWYYSDFNASYGFDDWNSLDTKEVKHRSSYYFRKLHNKMQQETSNTTRFIYMVPYVSYSGQVNFSDRVSSNTKVTFKRR